MANDTIYGLAASAWTNDLTHAHRLAKRLDAGSITLNCMMMWDPNMPFGGFKQSGWGYENGQAASRATSRTRPSGCSSDLCSFPRRTEPPRIRAMRRGRLQPIQRGGVEENGQSWGLDPGAAKADSGRGKHAEHLQRPRPAQGRGRCISVAGGRKTVSEASSGWENGRSIRRMPVRRPCRTERGSMTKTDAAHDDAPGVWSHRSSQQRLVRILPFALVASEVSSAHSSTPPTWRGSGCRRSRSWQLPPCSCSRHAATRLCLTAACYVASVAALMMASGGVAASGLGTLFFLPVVGVAMYGERRDSAIIVALVVGFLTVVTTQHATGCGLDRPAPGVPRRDRGGDVRVHPRPPGAPRGVEPAHATVVAPV